MGDDLSSAEPGGDTPDLTGYRVAVTAERRREELGNLFTRRGADVTYAPALRLVPLEDDVEALAATRRCVELGPDIVVATTGVGFRGWMSAVSGWDVADAMGERLRSARLIARGPKARGAIRAAGLREEWSPESESSAGVLAHLLEEDLTGVRIAVQLHGDPLIDVIDGLRGAGADVVTVPVYRWLPPEDERPVHGLLDDVLARRVDCLTFTSAPAAASILRFADSRGDHDDVVEALRSGEILVASVGPVTAAPLDAVGVVSLMPDRARLGALAREVIAALSARTPRSAQDPRSARDPRSA